MNGEQGTTEADEPDARTIARRHIAPLLKKLRGYGPAAASAAPTTVQPVVVVEPDPPSVADAAGVYRRIPEAPDQQPAAPFRMDSGLTAPVRKHRPGSATPTVGEVLHRQSGILGQLIAQAAKRVYISRVFQAYLPPHLHGHTVLLRLDQDAWTVQTESASWATRLRYALHETRQVLGDELGFPLPKPRILVKPVAAPVSSRRPRLTLTAQNAQLLEIAARNVSDTRLSAALQRLAAHASPAARTPAVSN